MRKGNKELREKLIIKNYTHSSLDSLLHCLNGIVSSCKEDFPSFFISDINEKRYVIECHKNKQSKRIIIRDGKEG